MTAPSENLLQAGRQLRATTTQFTVVDGLTGVAVPVPGSALTTPAILEKLAIGGGLFPPAVSGSVDFFTEMHGALQKSEPVPVLTGPGVAPDVPVEVYGFRPRDAAEPPTTEDQSGPETLRRLRAALGLLSRPVGDYRRRLAAELTQAAERNDSTAKEAAAVAALLPAAREKLAAIPRVENPSESLADWVSAAENPPMESLAKAAAGELADAAGLLEEAKTEAAKIVEPDGSIGGTSTVNELRARVAERLAVTRTVLKVVQRLRKKVRRANSAAAVVEFDLLPRLHLVTQLPEAYPTVAAYAAERLALYLAQQRVLRRFAAEVDSMTVRHEALRNQWGAAIPRGLFPGLEHPPAAAAPRDRLAAFLNGTGFSLRHPTLGWRSPDAAGGDRDSVREGAALSDEDEPSLLLQKLGIHLECQALLSDGTPQKSTDRKVPATTAPPSSDAGEKVETVSTVGGAVDLAQKRLAAAGIPAEASVLDLAAEYETQIANLKAKLAAAKDELSPAESTAPQRHSNPHLSSATVLVPAPPSMRSATVSPCVGPKHRSGPPSPSSSMLPPPVAVIDGEEYDRAAQDWAPMACVDVAPITGVTGHDTQRLVEKLREAVSSGHLPCIPFAPQGGLATQRRDGLILMDSHPVPVPRRVDTVLGDDGGTVFVHTSDVRVARRPSSRYVPTPMTAPVDPPGDTGAPTALSVGPSAVSHSPRDGDRISQDCALLLFNMLFSAHAHGFIGHPVRRFTLIGYEDRPLSSDKGSAAAAAAVGRTSPAGESAAMVSVYQADLCNSLVAFLPVPSFLVYRPLPQDIVARVTAVVGIDAEANAVKVEVDNSVALPMAREVPDLCGCGSRHSVAQAERLFEASFCNRRPQEFRAMPHQVGDAPKTRRLQAEVDGWKVRATVPEATCPAGVESAIFEVVEVNELDSSDRSVEVLVSKA